MAQRVVPSLPAAKLTGKTILITGANTGIGHAIAVDVAQRDPHLLILTARTKAKCEDMKENVVGKTNFKRISALELELNSNESIIAFERKVRGITDHLDIAVANAGVSTLGWKTATTGREQTMQTNVHGTFTLLSLLWPLIKSHKGVAHAIVVASDYCSTVDSLPSDGSLLRRMDDETATREADQDESETAVKGLSLQNRYAASKLLQIMLVQHLSRKWDSDKVALYTVCPGLVKSTFYRDFAGPQHAGFMQYLNNAGLTTEEGARNVLYPILTTNPAEAHGKHFSYGKVFDPSTYAASAHGRRHAEDIAQELGTDIRGIQPTTTLFA